MKNTDIAKIRQLLKLAEAEIGSAIEWAKYPRGAEDHGNRALDIIEKSLALLPCETCGGHKWTKGEPCSDCQS